MTSSRRNKFAAATVFLMISAVVVGGMTWATVTSFQLAKEHARKGHDRKIERAVSWLDAWAFGLLASEARRTRDYRPYDVLEPLAVIRRGQEVEGDLVVVASPLASGELPDWIDVYFQLEPLGDQKRLTTPQPVDDAALWRFRSSHEFQPWLPRARRTWEWLQDILPEIDLRERVAEVCQAQKEWASDGEADGDSEASLVVSLDASDRPTGRVTTEMLLRKRTFGDSQARYVPPTTCVDPEESPGVPRALMEAAPEPTETRATGGEIGHTPGTFVAFWLGTTPEGALKLAVVREVKREHESPSERSVYFQGFVSDWNQLRSQLHNQLTEVDVRGFEIEPLTPDSISNPGMIERQMYNLPVRLYLADIPGGASAAAWRQVGGKLVTTWLAAAAVLVVAGWGLHNLVRLTERRMQFAYAVTHELRTPLTTFRLYSDLLSAGLVPDDSKQTYLDTLHRESMRLSNLVEGVLEYSRLENQRVKLNLRDTDGESLLHPIRETLDRRCLENGIKPETQIALTNDQKLRTDVDVVHRIAGVLVNNACRHARGPQDAKVLVRLGNDNGLVYLDVIDTGPGVDRRDTRAIFRPFRRGRKADAAAQGGIGLGLALAKSWARLLGGDVELAARHHPQFGGAHFRLTFPARTDEL